MSRRVCREALNMRGEERMVATRKMMGSNNQAPTSPTYHTNQWLIHILVI